MFKNVLECSSVGSGGDRIPGWRASAWAFIAIQALHPADPETCHTTVRWPRLSLSLFLYLYFVCDFI